MKLHALCGSLRARSHNRSALGAIAVLAPPRSVTLDEFLPRLPLFNPDIEMTTLPAPVAALRAAVAASDALIIASPEYAHGLSGPLKNALDWLVGCDQLPGKPVMLVNTSPRAGHAQAQLREVLNTMACRVIEEATLVLPLIGTDHDAAAIAADAGFARAIRAALANLRAACAPQCGTPSPLDKPL